MSTKHYILYYQVSSRWLDETLSGAEKLQPIIVMAMHLWYTDWYYDLEWSGNYVSIQQTSNNRIKQAELGVPHS